MNKLKEISYKYQDDILNFLSELIKIKSYTGEEKEIANFIKNKMKELEYDEIIVTEYGDVIGRIGDGKNVILFDSHMDTVTVNDETEWKVAPFSGEIVDGKMYGRGTCDMKSAIASSVYAGFFAKKLGLLENKTVYVSASVMEEDFDGFALENIINTLPKKPDAVVICEPSDRQIALGHRGRALLEIHTVGISCHGSAPENGENAIYKMAELIKRVEELNKKLYEKEGTHGSVALTKIESTSVSLNAVPDECTIYLDRRLGYDEDYECIKDEMDTLVKGTGATWKVYQALGKSYTEKDVCMNSFMEAWTMKEDDTITKAMVDAFENVTNEEAVLFHWNFSTNGFASTKFNIPTIGYGPGIMKYCHMRDEHCNIKDVCDATAIYTRFINKFNLK